jgi:hypothetical protein
MLTLSDLQPPIAARRLVAWLIVVGALTYCAHSVVFRWTDNRWRRASDARYIHYLVAELAKARGDEAWVGRFRLELLAYLNGKNNFARTHVLGEVASLGERAQPFLSSICEALYASDGAVEQTAALTLAELGINASAVYSEVSRFATNGGSLLARERAVEALAAMNIRCLETLSTIRTCKRDRRFFLVPHSLNRLIEVEREVLKQIKAGECNTVKE